jgi:hypothetical protein
MRKAGQYEAIDQGVIKDFARVGRQEHTSDPIVVAKFFNPTGAGTWYATEYDPSERRCFLGMCPFLGIGMMNGVHSR